MISLSMAGGRPARGREEADGALDEVVKLLGTQGLREVLVEARGEAFLAVALHGAGRHGDDRDVPPGRLLALADQRGRLEAAEVGHLHVHQHQVEGLGVVRGQRLQSILGHGHLVPAALEQVDRQRLVDGVVLGQQDAERARRRGGPGGSAVAVAFAMYPCRWRTGQRSALLVRPMSARRGGGAGDRRGLEDSRQRLQEVGLRDRLGQVVGHAQGAAAGGVAGLVGRRQHHDDRAGKVGVVLDLLGQEEAVHSGHHGVEQDERERVAVRRRPGASAPAPRRPTRRRWVSCPSS